MKCILYIILLVYGVVCRAEIYKHIPGNNEINNRRPFQIGKDARGYMWFMTSTGINRYDGTILKHYDLLIDGKSVYADGAQLYTDRSRELWIATQEGALLSYNRKRDRYELIENFQKHEDEAITFLGMDSLNRIWFSSQTDLYAYNIQKRVVRPIHSAVNGLTRLLHVGTDRYFVTSADGIFTMKLSQDTLMKLTTELTDRRCRQVTQMIYHPKSHKLIWFDKIRGLGIYDCASQQCLLSCVLLDAPVTCMRVLNHREILIATDGAGSYRMDTENGQLTRWVGTNLVNRNFFSSNRIVDIYLDEDKRIWLADYSAGITVWRDCDWNYQQHRYLPNNRSSMMNGRIHAVLRDSEGDLWFATDSGVCSFRPQTQQWKQVSIRTDAEKDCSVYTALCEVAPGEIWAGNDVYGVNVIHKKKMKSELLDKEYKQGVHCFYKDSLQTIWTGYRNGLQSMTLSDRQSRWYTLTFSPNVILGKDKDWLWIGTKHGLFVLHKRSGQTERILEHIFINTLHQLPNGWLFIGTEGKGLLIYDTEHRKIVEHSNQFSTLYPRTIYAILPDSEGNLLMSTSSGVARFCLNDSRFYLLPTEPLNGMEARFMRASAAFIEEGKYFFGTSAGIVEMDSHFFRITYGSHSRICFDDFKLLNQGVGNTDFSLLEPFDDVHTFELANDQNAFSFRAAIINYDSPSDMLYTWKLNNEEWSTPSSQGVISYTSLRSGNYLLSVRALSRASGNPISQRNLAFIIHPSVWVTNRAFLAYSVVLLLLLLMINRVFRIWRELELSREKMSAMAGVANRVYMPLTLLRTPLEQLSENTLPERLTREFRLIKHHAKGLERLIANLIHIERISIYSEELQLTENELSTYLKSLFEKWVDGAVKRNMVLRWQNQAEFTRVWIDKEKVEAILRELMIGLMVQLKDGSEIVITTLCTVGHWQITLEAPDSSFVQKEKPGRLKTYCRESPDGMGGRLLQRLIHIHKGRIAFAHKHDKVTLTLLFPIAIKQANISLEKTINQTADSVMKDYSATQSGPFELSRIVHSILLIEGDEKLRSFWERILSDSYFIVAVSDAQEAQEALQRTHADLIFLNVELPETSGCDFCTAIKSNSKTAHIPVILFASSVHDEFSQQGLDCKADRYIELPFDISLLKREIDALIVNREIVKKKYMKMLLDAGGTQLVDDDSMLDEKQRLVTKARRIIEEKLADSNFDVEVLCADMGISRSGFYSKIKLATGYSPSEYIRIVKLQRAVHLLLTREYSISEIADLTGFSDSKQFRELFKKHYGCSPSKYIHNL